MKKLIISFLLVLSYVFAVGQSMPNYWVPTSGTNTYSTNITSFGSSYNNKILFVRFTNANTSTATININSIGAAPIRKWDGVSWSTLASGDIDTDRDYRLSYDNTNGWFRLEAISPAFGSGPLVMGVATNTDAPIAPIFGSTDGHSLRIAGGVVGFGPVPLDDPDATTGSLPATNISFSPTGGISTGNVQNALTEVDAEKTSHVWLDNEQTTNYTAVLTDVNKVIQMNSASALNFTVPPNASVAFPTGTYLVVRQKGAGTVTIVPGSGVTVTQPAGGTLDTPGQGLSVTLHKTGTNTWDLENGSVGGGGGSGTVTDVTGTSPIVITGTSTVTPNVTISNAAADGTTKGAASFTANDFNASSGNVSIDYTNGQSASASNKGFLTSTDYAKFRNKPITLSCTDLLSSLTIGTNKAFYYVSDAFTVTGVRAMILNEQESGTILTIDINENGTTILSTKLTIDNGENRSETAATPAVISDTAISAGALITIDFDAVGSGGAGVIVEISGYY